MSGLNLPAISGRHVRWTVSDHNGGIRMICGSCKQSWPCLTRLLLNEISEAREELRQETMRKEMAEADVVRGRRR